MGSEFKLDNNYIATPYRVVMKKGEPNSRKFLRMKKAITLNSLFSLTFVTFANLDFPPGRDGISIYQNI